MAQTFTDENIRDIIASGKPVVIDFWATWCGPCRAMAPAIDQLAQEYEGRVEIGKYNVDEEGDISSDYRIMSLPTILIFKDGKKTDLRLLGSQSIDNLRLPYPSPGALCHRGRAARYQGVPPQYRPARRAHSAPGF